jgi:tetratricopeptide (TPR) repeat protein
MVDPPYRAFFRVWPCLLLITLMVILPVEPRAGERLKSPPSRRSLAGRHGGKAEETQGSGNNLPSQLESALAKGELNDVRRVVSKVLQEPGLAADILLQIGVNLAQHDLYSEASAVFKRCAKDYPEVFEAYYNLSLSQLALQQPQDALYTLAKAPHGSPDEEVARTYLRGKIELALQQDAEAERDLSMAFAAAPQEENFGLDLGLCYIRERKYPAAAEVFQKALGFQKDSPFLRLGLATAQYLGGLSDESIETCRTILSMQPSFSPARVMMAFALYMQGRIDEAAKLSAQGLGDPNPFPYLYYIHAASLLKLQSKDYDTMVKDLTLAIRSIPRCSLCYLSLSKAHRRKRDLAAARADLEKAVDLDPTFAEAWYNLATVYQEGGQNAEAESARHRFEELKENQANRETEMLRDAFVKALGVESSSKKEP